MLGSLNVHIWQAWCGSTIHDLRRNKFFPLYPDVRLTIKKFFVRHWESDYGQRIFGYVHPPASGNQNYALVIASQINCGRQLTLVDDTCSSNSLRSW